MDALKVSVTVKDLIWDQFIILNDNIVFCENAQLQDAEQMQPNQLCEVNKSKQCFGKSLHTNGQDLLEKVNKLDISSHGEAKTYSIVHRQHKYIPKLYINGYVLSLFVKTLKQSAFYRKQVIARFHRLQYRSAPPELNIKLVPSHEDIIDYSWGKRMENLALERRELDMAMSWLSTLGGAFSALGEEFQQCAEIAGRISVRQFSIALRLGDPLTVARCKLYLALSLVQRGHLAQARRIIQEQYRLAREPPAVDTRLVSMCLGIWARLKYEYQKKRASHCKRYIQTQQYNSTVHTFQEENNFSANG